METCTHCGTKVFSTDAYGICHFCYRDLSHPEKEWDEGPDEFDWRADRELERQEIERRDHLFVACYGRRIGGRDV